MSRKRVDIKRVIDLSASLHAADRLRQLSARDQTKSKPWYSIKAQGPLDTEVMIYAEIGEWGVTALDFVQELRSISTPNISVRINSPGGQVFDGFSIYNGLLNHPARITAYIDGVAASAASFIAQAADEIVCAKASSMMVHGASGVCIGKSADMREMADLLDKLNGQMAAIYAQRTERPSAEWLAQMGVDTWYTADEAVTAGLADRVAELQSADTTVDAEAKTTQSPTAAGNQQPEATSPDADEVDEDPFLRVFQEV